MAQPAEAESNGALRAESHEPSTPVPPAKRKRDSVDSSDDINGVVDQKPVVTNGSTDEKQKELVQSCYAALARFDLNPPILKRPLPEPKPDDEPEAKRQKSADPASLSISDKVQAEAYEDLQDMMLDVATVVKASLKEIQSSSTENAENESEVRLASKLIQFKTKAIDILRREASYPQPPSSLALKGELKREDPPLAPPVLSLVGYAPQERRLFSSLPVSDDVDLAELSLPLGVSTTRIYPAKSQERVQTLGDLFAPPRTLMTLQPPKQPKSQAKGNRLDFYHPELSAKSPYRGSSYFTTNLSAGHYLDYSNASPPSSAKTKQHERAASLAGKKPSTTELEQSEMDALFRGAFSSFAPCKDDSEAIVSSNMAGRLWWQHIGRPQFEDMIELEYGDEAQDDAKVEPVDIDEAAIQDAIDNWDATNVDPSLVDAMGPDRTTNDKEVDKILEEVTDLIETLSSYQRIRNLSLPNSQNRQSSDPVAGDMLGTAGPQPSEDEQMTYEMLKTQLAFIIKTLPPFAVAKLNGDQLDDLLISTKMQIATDQYKGIMEEDDAGVQARIRMQQQQQAQQAQQAQQQQQVHMNSRPAGQRAGSFSQQGQYTPGNQYATPRTPSHNQQYFRPSVAGQFSNYQLATRVAPPTTQQPRMPQPNQYTRQNGYVSQYATQLAKAQTPYGHQNMRQSFTQQRPAYGQMPAQGTPTTRYNFAPGYQPAGSPSPGGYTNGSGMPQRQMSPQMSHMQSYSPSPTMQQQQRYGTPNVAMGGQLPRPPSNPSIGQHHGQGQVVTGYHTVIPEAQQQRILEQAKARVAAQERSAMFAEKLPGVSGLAGIGLSGTMDVNKLATRMNMSNQQKPPTPVGQRPGMGGMNGTPTTPNHVPLKVTPVPVPPIPGLPPRKPST